MTQKTMKKLYLSKWFVTFVACAVAFFLCPLVVSAVCLTTEMGAPYCIHAGQVTESWNADCLLHTLEGNVDSTAVEKFIAEGPAESSTAVPIDANDIFGFSDSVATLTFTQIDLTYHQVDPDDCSIFIDIPAYTTSAYSCEGTQADTESELCF